MPAVVYHAAYVLERARKWLRAFSQQRCAIVTTWCSRCAACVLISAPARWMTRSVGSARRGGRASVTFASARALATRVLLEVEVRGSPAASTFRPRPARRAAQFAPMTEVTDHDVPALLQSAAPAASAAAGCAHSGPARGAGRRAGLPQLIPYGAAGGSCCSRPGGVLAIIFRKHRVLRAAQPRGGRFRGTVLVRRRPRRAVSEFPEVTSPTGPAAIFEAGHEFAPAAEARHGSRTQIAGACAHARASRAGRWAGEQS